MGALTSKKAAFLLLSALALVACGTTSTEPELTEEPEVEEPPPPPPGWPEVPRPAHASDFDVPPRSESPVTIMPIDSRNVDFAATWTEGTFTWDIDIQTQYE
jgi:hypothetical protein